MGSLTDGVKQFSCLCPGGVPQGQDLTRAISREEVKALLGDQECEVKTLDNTHLYCEPPEIQPMSVDDGSELPSLKVRALLYSHNAPGHLVRHVLYVSIERRRVVLIQTINNQIFNVPLSLPIGLSVCLLGLPLSPAQVFMGHLQVDLGLVQYDSNSLLSPIPLAAQIGLGAGAAVIILSVLVVILMYR